MALNPALILAGQPFDLAGSMSAGNQLAAQTNQLRDQNALRQVYQTQGAGILSGDQNALNALAMVDPGQAMQMQAGQLDMQATRQRMDMLTREEQRQIEAAKASMTAEQAAQAAQQIEDAVKMGLAINDPAQWDAVMAQNAPQLVGQFANKQAVAMKYMTMAEALKANAGPEPLSSEGKLAVDIRNGIVQPGSIAAGGDNQTERDIALLGEIGIPRQQAIRITQLYVISKDPVTGEQVLVDKSTGRPVSPEEVQAQIGAGGTVQQPAPVQPAQQPAQGEAAQPSQTLTFGQQYQNAPGVFGWEGLLKRGANAVSDVVPGIGTAFPVEQQSLSDFRVLGEALVNDIASAYPRQPPSWLLQNIAELTPKPGSVWEGPDSAAAKLRSLGASMQGELRLAKRQLEGRISPTQRQELELRKQGIEAALNRITTALTALEPAPSANVAPEDIDLMNQLLGGN